MIEKKISGLPANSENHELLEYCCRVLDKWDNTFGVLLKDIDVTGEKRIKKGSLVYMDIDWNCKPYDEDGNQLGYPIAKNVSIRALGEDGLKTETYTVWSSDRNRLSDQRSAVNCCAFLAETIGKSKEVDKRVRFARYVLYDESPAGFGTINFFGEVSVFFLLLAIGVKTGLTGLIVLAALFGFKILFCRDIPTITFLLHPFVLHKWNRTEKEVLDILDGMEDKSLIETIELPGSDPGPENLITDTPEAVIAEALSPSETVDSGRAGITNI